MLTCDFNKFDLNFIEIVLRHGYYSVNLLHIFRTLFARLSMRGCFWLGYCQLPVFQFSSCWRTVLCNITLTKTTLLFWKKLIQFKHALRKKCPYSELSWSTFSRIRTEYGEIISKFNQTIWEWRNEDSAI